jgi:hypothetical protein
VSLTLVAPFIFALLHNTVILTLVAPFIFALLHNGDTLAQCSIRHHLANIMDSRLAHGEHLIDQDDEGISLFNSKSSNLVFIQDRSG